MFRIDVLQNDHVRYANQPIAVVIAATLEAATEGAALLAPRYETEPARTGLDAGESFVPPFVGVGMPAEVHHGDVEAGLAAASDADRRDLRNAGAIPQRDGAARDRGCVGRRQAVDRHAEPGPGHGAGTASPGCSASRRRTSTSAARSWAAASAPRGFMTGPQVLGIMAARLVGKPVKLVLRREQMFGPVGHRAADAADAAHGHRPHGALTAIEHHTKTASSTFDDFFEPASDISHTLYASPAIATSHEAVRLDTGTPMFMRAPGEATGSIALESAIDEMAQACGMDPLAFRLTNYAEVEPISGKPFSSKALRECYAQGAERFGWARRPLAPRQMRDEAGLLVGWGMGTAVFPALMFQANARAVIRNDGTGVVETGAHDMGQGAWTALAQIAADGLGLDIDQVEFRSGTSDLPDAGIAGGSAHTATAGMAIHGAGADVIAKLADLATGDAALAAVRRRQRRRGCAWRPAVPPRRREPQRKLCGHPCARRRRGNRGARARARPIRRRNRATRCMRTGRCSPRSRSIPNWGRSASPAWSAPSRPVG